MLANVMCRNIYTRYLLTTVYVYAKIFEMDEGDLMVIVEDLDISTASGDVPE